MDRKPSKHETMDATKKFSEKSYRPYVTLFQTRMGGGGGVCRLASTDGNGVYYVWARKWTIAHDRDHDDDADEVQNSKQMNKSWRAREQKRDNRAERESYSPHISGAFSMPVRRSASDN